MIVVLQAHFSGQADVDYFLMAVNVLVVFYLNQRDVQYAFGHDRPVPAEDIQVSTTPRINA
jgi:hypothetical protein